MDSSYRKQSWRGTAIFGSVGKCTCQVKAHTRSCQITCFRQEILFDRRNSSEITWPLGSSTPQVKLHHKIIKYTTQHGTVEFFFDPFPRIFYERAYFHFNILCISHEMKFHSRSSLLWLSDVYYSMYLYCHKDLKVTLPMTCNVECVRMNTN